ncbi:oligogalacturonate lyase family protein [Marinomonas mediterranea]|jgi:Periplasmic component of the Tol biopolymer transport system|uniref:Oligogalacturonide lyase n=1 Tax=Marinomonas mediterranea (strain ATCC 700492 / JCM 21426 / NBRC 103028 / MMB-1) TaxID=717774 RepID=F2K0A4_MARM1|nr:oligogalacturonate lyase family protein [Marinomonas mediterranea]ADZ89819.1 Oligogalacturonide lyase [Marinomonas mediterranea MMB-1]WCN16040.1 oligogalacturonate lyase [Marinomonas mediterranea MMB-1]
MATGNTIPLSFNTYFDALTGNQVTQLTPNDAVCHRNYFYQKCFSENGDKLLFAGDFDGPWNYYLMDLDEQSAVQLTQGTGDNTFGGFLTTQGDALIFMKNNHALIRVDIKTQEHHTIYEVEKGWVGYGTWVANRDCTKIVGIEIKAEDHMPLTDWKKFAEFYHKNPRCRLISIDMQTGERTVILDQNVWMGHPLYRPFDDNTVAFCHEGPHDLIETRMWFVNEDGTDVRKVYEQTKEESCTHEFFVPDGSKMMFVSYTRGETERWLYSVDPNTLEEKRETIMPACSHLMSNYDGSLVVGDGSGTPVDVADSSGHELENDDNIYVFDLKAGTTKAVCQHKTSWEVLNNSRQVNHPHPSFTPDSKGVLYSSDMNGTPALYIAAI